MVLPPRYYFMVLLAIIAAKTHQTVAFLPQKSVVKNARSRISFTPNGVNTFRGNIKSIVRPVKNNEEETATNEKSNSNDFWLAQKELAQSMSDAVETKGKSERKILYEKRTQALVSESFFFSILIFNLLWFVCTNPFTPFSYLFGALLGTAYTYGLGKSVAVLGGTVDDTEDVKGAGIGSARFAFLILLFVFVGKFRAQGMQEIPAIFGFFTYQLASLSQGLKEIDD